MKVKAENKPWSMDINCTGNGNEMDNAKKGCLPCNRTLEITGRDIFRTSSRDMCGDESGFFTIKCPCCNSLTDLTPSQIKELPKSVYYYAQTRTEANIDSERINSNSDLSI